MIVLGVDPGLEGVLCWMNSEDFTVLYWQKMPTLTITRNGNLRRRILDMQTLRGMLVPTHAGMLVMEDGGTRPGQSVAGARTIGYGAGAAEAFAMVNGLPFHPVPPATWKGRLKLLTLGKDGSMLRVGQLYPHLNLGPPGKAHNAADAILIARWFCQYELSQK